MTPGCGRSTAPRSPRFARAVLVGLGLLVVSCSSSDGVTSESTPAVGSSAATDDGGDVFSENATESVDGTSAESIEEVSTDSSAPESSSTATDDTADEAAVGDTAPGEDTATTETTTPISVDGVDNLDEVDGFVDFDLVDDVPFCQSYARVFEAFIAVSFGGAFGPTSSADPDAISAPAETYEVILYPGLVDDVATIRAEEFPEIEEFLAPVLERIELAPELLRDAGLSEPEIAELTASAKASDLDSIDLDALDPRVTDAANAMIAQAGSFVEVSESMVEPDESGPAEDRFTELCPELASLF